MHQENVEFESINLMEYIAIAWKRRWQIVIPTVVLAILAAIVSFLLPKIWEVDAIIIPSKFLTQNQAGEFKQVLVVEPKQIANQIAEGSYNSLIGAELNIPDREFPKITAENLRDTNLIRVSVRERNVGRGRQIVAALFNHLKSDFDKKIDVEINSLNTQVEQTKNRILDIEIEKDKINKEIESDRNKLRITEERITSIREEMKSVKTRTDELDRLQQKSLTEKREGTETLALLLYSNEVQLNLRYFSSLDEKNSAEQMNENNLEYSIKNKENEIRKLQNTISDANNDIKLFEDKKNRIDYTQLVKEPTPSFGPVSPNKKQIVLIAGFIGFCLSVGIAFFREGLENRKKDSLPKT
jgi:LPS O-antigen subunit length determinant protein (WzzB/FepE family)